MENFMIYNKKEYEPPFPHSESAKYILKKKRSSRTLKLFYISNQIPCFLSIPPLVLFGKAQHYHLKIVDSLNKKDNNNKRYRVKVAYTLYTSAERSRVIFRVTWDLLITVFPFVTYWKIALLIFFRFLLFVFI